MTDKELMELAYKARESSYSPYSGISVGAALLCDNGEVFLGANVENAAFSPTVCAERVALFSAVFSGKRAFSAIAIVGGKGGEAPSTLFSPCGVCRQALSEFCNGDMRVIMTDGKALTVKTLSELLPLGFSSDNL